MSRNEVEDKVVTVVEIDDDAKTTTLYIDCPHCGKEVKKEVYAYVDLEAETTTNTHTRVNIKTLSVEEV